MAQSAISGRGLGRRRRRLLGIDSCTLMRSVGVWTRCACRIVSVVVVATTRRRRRRGVNCVARDDTIIKRKEPEAYRGNLSDRRRSSPANDSQSYFKPPPLITWTRFELEDAAAEFDDNFFDRRSRSSRTILSPTH